MAPTPDDEIPNLGQIIGPFLQRIVPEQRPLLVAIAERLAAVRYRAWASDSTDAAQKQRLLACADREEQIASRVEALYANAESIQRDLRSKHPDLEDINRSVFAARPLEQQFAIQAQGERLGAATWRSFAGKEANSSARETFLVCAELEEASALVLESIAGADV